MNSPLLSWELTSWVWASMSMPPRVGNSNKLLTFKTTCTSTPRNCCEWTTCVLLRHTTRRMRICEHTLYPWVNRGMLIIRSCCITYQSTWRKVFEKRVVAMKKRCWFSPWTRLLVKRVGYCARRLVWSKLVLTSVQFVLPGTQSLVSVYLLGASKYRASFYGFQREKKSSIDGVPKVGRPLTLCLRGARFPPQIVPVASGQLQIGYTHLTRTMASLKPQPTRRPTASS